MRLLVAALLLLGAQQAYAQCATPLAAGQAVTFDQPLPAGSLTTSACIDVPESAERLTVRLTGNMPAQDLDLLIRVGSPFTEAGSENVNGLTVDDYYARAHYLSSGVRGEESVVITRSSRQPLRAGQLYLVLINYSNTPARFSLSSELGSATDYAPIQVVFDDTAGGECNVSGWNDATPTTPVRGNAGTTLGQQRRIALQESARLIGEQIRPNVPIRVRACWTSIEMTSSGGTLAQAGPRYVVVDDPGRGLVYPGLDSRHVAQFTPAASHQMGVPFCQFAGESCNAPKADIVATFNLEVDKATNTSQRFEYGLTASQTGPGQPAVLGYSFVATAMHELGHGFGFIGLIGGLSGTSSDALGSRVSIYDQPYDDAFGRHVRINDNSGAQATSKAFLRVDDQTRAAALTSGTSLRFDGPNTTPSLNNVLRNNIAPYNSAQLHAPSGVASGSSYSHLGNQHYQQLMLPTISIGNPLRSLGLAREVLFDVGYDPAPKNVPARPLPAENQYFDISRNGHGVDFRRVADTPDLYYLSFYTYDSNGNPEWYTSLGRVIDGIFVPQTNNYGDSLLRFDYNFGPPGVSVVDASPAYNGQIRVDFVDAARSPACARIGISSAQENLAVVTWTLGSLRQQWCVQPTVDPTAEMELNLGGAWYDPADAGWGLTTVSFPGDGGDGIAVIIYYPDANGKGRWGIVQTARYTPGETYPVRQVRGYCRETTCASPDALEFIDIGTMKVDLRSSSEGPSTISFDIAYPGNPSGVRFQRSNSPMMQATNPLYSGN